MTYEQQPEEPAANVVREKIETDHDGHFLITVRCPVCKMPLVCRMQGRGTAFPCGCSLGKGGGKR